MLGNLILTFNKLLTFLRLRHIIRNRRNAASLAGCEKEKEKILRKLRSAELLNHAAA